ncbi:MAG: hypothetical protein ACYCQK_01305 [Acidiferrobacteraceae bacterium]
MAEAAASRTTPQESPSQAIERAVVNLSKGTWGTLGSTILGILIAAGAWATSMKSDLQTAISKIDSVTSRLDEMARRFEKIEDRVLNVERILPRASRPAPDTE